MIKFGSGDRDMSKMCLPLQTFHLFNWSPYRLTKDTIDSFDTAVNKIASKLTNIVLICYCLFFME